jgi:hypothetical protein
MFIVALQLLRRGLRISAVECDGADISANDYTIHVEDIPREIQNALNDDYDDDLLDFFEN